MVNHSRQLIYFQCVVLPTSVIQDKRNGAVYCVMISVARTFTSSNKSISKSAFVKHGVPF